MPRFYFMDILALLSLLAIAGLIAWNYHFYTPCQAAILNPPASAVSATTYNAPIPPQPTAEAGEKPGQAEGNTENP